MGVALANAAPRLTVAQFDLLRWVSGGCKDGVYEGTSHRVSARSLHNRGLVRVTGKSATWNASITPEGTRMLEAEAKRVEAERERVRREAEVKAQKQREQAQLREQAVELLSEVVAAGGRLDVGTRFSADEITKLCTGLRLSGALPVGQRLAQEPTRMDPVFGVTVYLEPDFAALTALRTFTVPGQLRDPHPAVAAFRDKKDLVSRAEVGRAARFLQALAMAATTVGWKATGRPRNEGYGRTLPDPDLILRLPSRELVVSIRELDQRGRRVTAFITETDYYTRTTRTIANKHFEPSGKLEVKLSRKWEDETVLAMRDELGARIEDQLPTLIRALEIAEAEAEWSHKEEERRAEIRKVRWEEVKQEALVKVAYDRNAAQLGEQLDRWQAAAAMRMYADDIESCTEELDEPARTESTEWAAWIRAHADDIDPLNGPLRLLRVISASHDELGPHMNGWNTYGPYRR
ncbi:hypothetical protein [Mycobacterium parmense]|uniref:Uncharacterized protein n=1 Tax=Mycobacterium parmense TaxID=185642 RepID=A0A7I7YP79_9MYCO|nr:hypothetical protein [Mycobacterium parmense]MCV7349691.1 hypothetical protein [Mycobacterium parmense]ORW51853.1 hypothetical protein AWC20_22185 [Mycobacterium parmense]BBZ43656.1 hypothetical protein MPRM_09370 [Mycobacterium parmense]